MSQEALIKKKNDVDRLICLYNNLLYTTEDEEFYFFLLRNIIDLENESLELDSHIIVKQEGFSYV